MRVPAQPLNNTSENKPLRIEEPAAENFLYRLWRGLDVLPHLLKTTDGRQVEVRFPGTRNLDSGPDYKDAVIAIDGKISRGDVEVHPYAGDWFAHQHHCDPRYNSVILHIVTEKIPPEMQTTRADGVEVPMVNLDEFLEKSAEEMAEDFEAEEKPSESLEETCRLREYDAEQILQWLERAGDERLAIKAERFLEERPTDSWDQIFYRGLMEALGYSKNQIPFRKLANRLPISELWPEIRHDDKEVAAEKVQANLFGAAGLLPAGDDFGTVADQETLDFVRRLKEKWEAFPFRRKIDPMRPEEWQFFRLRPQNFPTRRLAAMSWLVVRFCEQGFIEGFLRILIGREKKFAAQRKDLEERLLVRASGYWEKHYSFDDTQFGVEPKVQESHLIGKDRAREIVVNIVLPALLAYAQETEDSKIRNRVLEAYAHYPKLVENSITKMMRRQLFGKQAGVEPFVTTARQQQGMIEIYKQFCLRQQCEECIKVAEE